jgi:hypothetical protein
VLFPCLYGLAYTLLGVSLQLRLFPIGDIDLETDFYADLVIAARKLGAGEFSVHDFAWKGPVYALLLLPIRAVVEDWYRGAVILSAISAGAALLLVYRLVLRLFDRRTAVATTIATSLVAELFVQSHRATTDVLFLLLLLASVQTTLLAGASLRRYAAAGGLAALACLTRYNGVFLVGGTLLFLLVMNPDRLGWRDRKKALAVYAAVFVLVVLPWLAANVSETGRPLATRNAETVVTALFGDSRFQADVIEQNGSLRALVAMHPTHALAQFGRNLGNHVQEILNGLLGWPLALVPILGVLGWLVRPPTRRQAGLYLFAAVYAVSMGVVFYAPRFFLPVIPACMALGFAFLRRDYGGAGSRFLNRRLTAAWQRRAAIGVLAGFVCALVVVQVPRIVATEREIHARRPLYILDAARHLAATEGHTQPPRQRHTPGQAPARIMARKGHIAYHAGFDFEMYSASVASLEELVRLAHAKGVEYIVYSRVEYSLLPRMLFFAVTDTIPLLHEVYRGDGIRVFTPEPGEPSLSEEQRHDLLLANLRAARAQRRPAAIHTALIDLGLHDMARHEVERAAARFREGVEVAEQADGGGSVAWQAAVAREHLAVAELEQGNAEAAVANLQKNANYFASLGAERDLHRTDAMLRRARAALASGRPAAPEKP